MKRFVHTVSAAALAIGLGTAAAQDAPTNVYFGDTHLHTGNSFDVYLFGTPTSTPETAVRFAKGLPVVSPTTGTPLIEASGV